METSAAFLCEGLANGSRGEECEAAHRDAAIVLAVAAVRMQRNPTVSKAECTIGASRL